MRGRKAQPINLWTRTFRRRDYHPTLIHRIGLTVLTAMLLLAGAPSSEPAAAAQGPSLEITPTPECLTFDVTVHDGPDLVTVGLLDAAGGSHLSPVNQTTPRKTWITLSDDPSLNLTEVALFEGHHTSPTDYIIPAPATIATAPLPVDATDNGGWDCARHEKVAPCFTDAPQPGDKCLSECVAADHSHDVDQELLTLTAGNGLDTVIQYTTFLTHSGPPTRTAPVFVRARGSVPTDGGIDNSDAFQAVEVLFTENEAAADGAVLSTRYAVRVRRATGEVDIFTNATSPPDWETVTTLDVPLPLNDVDVTATFAALVEPRGYSNLIIDVDGEQWSIPEAEGKLAGVVDVPAAANWKLSTTFSLELGTTYSGVDDCSPLPDGTTATIAYDLSEAGVFPCIPSLPCLAEAPGVLPQVGVVLADPCVAYDSALVTDGASGPLNGQEGRTVDLVGDLTTQGGQTTSGCVPRGCASSVIFSVQAIDPVQPGNLRLSPAGSTPLGGVVNYTGNDLNNANTVTVAPNGADQVDIFANSQGSGPATNVRLLVLGYYVDPGNVACAGGSNLLEFHPLDPCAVADTRMTTSPTPSGAFAGPALITSAGNRFDVDVVDPITSAQNSGLTEVSCGIPANAEVAVVNVVAIGAPSKGGLNVGRGGSNPLKTIVPFNDTSPVVINNSAVMYAPIVNGEIAVMPQGVTNDRVHFRVVVLGYMKPADGTGLLWSAVPSPCAVFDTRFGSGTFSGLRDGANTTSPPPIDNLTTYDIAGTFPAAQGGRSTAGGTNTDCGVPDGAAAVQLNLVAINATAPGNLRAGSTTTFSGGVTNFAALNPPMSNSNGITVPLTTTGAVHVEANGITSDLVHIRGVILGYYS